jgi:hypothetical protein
MIYCNIEFPGLLQGYNSEFPFAVNHTGRPPRTKNCCITRIRSTFSKMCKRPRPKGCVASLVAVICYGHGPG